MLPHQLFANLYHHYRSEFRRRILGAEGTIEHFWNTMSDHPALNDHPNEGEAQLEKQNCTSQLLSTAMESQSLALANHGSDQLRFGRGIHLWRGVDYANYEFHLRSVQRLGVTEVRASHARRFQTRDGLEPYGNV